MIPYHSVPDIIGPLYALGTLFLEIRGVVRGEATRDAPVPVPDRPVRDGLQVLSFRPICVRDGIILPRFLSSFRTTFLSYYTCILTFKLKCLNNTK